MSYSNKFENYLYNFCALTLAIFFLFVNSGCKKKEQEGCTNELATNFDSDATIDDFSCIFELPNGYTIEGDFSNRDNSTPTFTISSFDEQISLYKTTKCSLFSNKVEIIIDSIKIDSKRFDDDGSEFNQIKNLRVNELRDNRWEDDIEYEYSFTEYTSVGVLLIIQKSSAGKQRHENIISFSLELLDFFSSHSNIKFEVGLLEYGDNINILKDFSDGKIISSATLGKYGQLVGSIKHESMEANSMNDAIIEGIDLFEKSSLKTDYNSIFIIGDGTDNVVNSLNGAIENINKNSIKDFYCIGVEDGMSFPSSGETNFQRLAEIGNGYFQKINISGKVKDIFDKFYINIPNSYQLTYVRSGLKTESPINLQWNLTCEPKK